jgi:FeS assembly SUF system protein
MKNGIEHLKKYKIDRATAPPGRRGLPIIHESPPEAEVREAYGGCGEDVGAIDVAGVRERIIEALKHIYDPEIPVNVYDLGLIYGFELSADGEVELAMTLTAPACPVAGMLVQEVARRVGEVAGVSRAHVSLTWDPPWTQDRMSEEARLELGLL